jgi:hypothetical protein
MPAELTPLTDEETTAINTRWSRFCVDPSHDNALTSAHDVPDLLAEVDRVRAQLAAEEKQCLVDLRVLGEVLEESDKETAEVRAQMYAVTEELRATKTELYDAKRDYVKMRSERDKLLYDTPKG